MKLENGITHGERGSARTKSEERPLLSIPVSPNRPIAQSALTSTSKDGCISQSPSTTSEKQEEIVGGEVTLKMEPGEPPKLARTSSQKIKTRPPRLYLDAVDKTMEARRHFDMLPGCNYANRHIGSTEHGSMDCDCEEEWGKLCYNHPTVGAGTFWIDVVSTQMVLPKSTQHVGKTLTASTVRQKWSV